MDQPVGAGSWDSGLTTTGADAAVKARAARLSCARYAASTGCRYADTTGSVGIPGGGTVFFRNFTLSAQWGRLNANGGVLRAADGSTLSVPVTGPLEGTTLQGKAGAPL